MDYKNIYYKIVERAKQEDDNGHRQLGYYEKHHIQPKSLGGTNNKANLVKLTAREHFLCHWLLVKMYNKGTIERDKMLYALWRMKSKNNIHERYINSRAYEALRIEYSGVISKITSIKQSGEKNSQFGKKWYTNRDTGESKSFFKKPSDTWIKGRNWFNHVAKYEIYSIETKQKIYDCKGHLKSKVITERKKFVEELWNEFLSSDYDSVRQFNMIKNPSLNLHALFRKFIPEYKNHKVNLTKFSKCPLV